jgi:hypothetical protein
MWGDRMPIKGMFNQKAQKKNADEWEKQILRINALEVQMKSLLEFEKKIRTSMYRNSSGEKKEQERIKTQSKDFQVKNLENTQKVNEINEKLEKLGQSVYQLEKFIEEKERFHSKNPLPKKEENKLDERLNQIIEQLILEKYAVHFQREKQFVKKIQALENQISILNDSIKVPYVDPSIIEDHRETPSEDISKLDERLNDFIEQLILEKYAVHFQREQQLVEKIQALENQISILNDSIKVPSVDQSEIEDHRQAPSEDSLGHTSEKRDEQEVFCTQIEMRVQQLESNLLLVNEVQAGLLKRMEELIEKNYVLIKKMDETEVSMKKEEPIFKTLYIDKLYLEKYEQNNNFAQLGIKSLSGALNIGATYGKEAIPKEITEQVKEDMEKMKEMKAEMENSQPSTDQSDDIHHDESSSEVAFDPSEENIPYTDIVIEDDDSSLGGDSFNDDKSGF